MLARWPEHRSERLRHHARRYWKYSRPTPDHLEIDGVHRGKRFHVATHLAPDPLLITRGFHWINETPFNR